MLVNQLFYNQKKIGKQFPFLVFILCCPPLSGEKGKEGRMWEKEEQWKAELVQLSRQET